MNKELLKEYLSNRYQGWESFLNNIIFPIFGKDDFEDGYEAELLDSQPEHRKLAINTGIRSIKQVGRIYVGVEPLQIFDVTVSDRVMMERNRVNIQRLIRTVMDQFSCAFMLFHYEDDTRWDWRFTYCRKSAKKEETTDSKRFTFLLGPGQSCRTATDNFIALYEKRESLEIKNIEEAFNVEALSQEFFGKYKAQYEAFVNYMVDPSNGMRQDFIDTHFDHSSMTADKIRDREEKPIRDYVKKLLGRIVFLHFLQKKGWLGVPAGKEWGEGDRDFMLKLFENASPEQKENFLDEVLEGLFANGLDTNRSDNGDVYDTGVQGFCNCRIPYLNGGLFERDVLDEKTSRFPAKYFESLLTMLSQYNFTIDENDPNDAEVGVDPEMLGRIFENLLEDNKDKGAFYTPKEIVQYMCRESLIAYLQTDQKEDDKKRIRQFVTTHEVESLGELKKEVEQKLIDVKICDPAIGSGAFPMGLLRELFFCRSAIEPNIVEKAADIKRHIIQNNIYGVDIERGAVEIARLRFWLALIVDEKSPEVLPNLDFKIMQGNSLLEQYKGVDLSTMTKRTVDVGSQLTFFNDMLDVYCKELRDKLAEYYACPEHNKKVELRSEIAELVKQQLIEQHIYIDFEDLDLSANSQFFLWHTWFHDVFSRPSKEGFDIVIGNPPYGAKYNNQTKQYYKNTYMTANSIRGLQKGSLDTYTLFIELGYNLLRKNGCFAYIVPISLTSSDSLTGVHRILMDNCNAIHISSYAVRPKPVFENAVVNTSIVLFQKTETPCQVLYSTKMHRRGTEFDLQKLIDNLQFVDVKGLTLYGRIPKISSEIEKTILKKLFKQIKLGSIIKTSGSPITYRFAGGRYFKVVTNYSNNSSAERTIYFSNSKIANAVGCILSSNLSFWFYQIFSDNLNWKTYEIENFTIPQLTFENIDFLDKLYNRYLADIEANANTRITSEESTYNVDSFKEYKIVRSKRIIDEIDDYICPLYGLTQEETDFIKNYELEFRLAGE
ncbi:N-6 DNA methylase [Capnocytophaga genosp. AHN8471]|uniref:site-specific DNA-methyltransferase (adenine-specific) n=1 Tax=Capnocytophaga genosp. AHN8471 TaxID=327574 RepID=A0ABS1YYK8_9FLAO|nr:N-6 DNA methylase [Capnocytophaga genosp. AHN8471]MBM0651504.1 N-6 DNA methylase [Capnocytophaga genosp. AHN8471]MBM0663374.1 N-6 DNA methylase [Capnocytophaga genosp. AHN8471]